MSIPEAPYGRVKVFAFSIALIGKGFGNLALVLKHEWFLSSFRLFCVHSRMEKLAIFKVLKFSLND